MTSGLKVAMTMYLSDGTSLPIKALIDTGAEVNLVSRSLIDPHLFQPSEKPVRLGAANATRVSGGGHEVDMILGMQGVEQDTKRCFELRVPMRAYDAMIGHDIIISYGWLAQHNVVVWPQKHGMLFRDIEGESVMVEGIRSGYEVSEIVMLKSCDIITDEEWPGEEEEVERLRWLRLTPAEPEETGPPGRGNRETFPPVRGAGRGRPQGNSQGAAGTLPHQRVC